MFNRISDKKKARQTMHKSIFVGVRIDPERGTMLEQVSKQRGCNQSEAVRWLLDQVPLLLSQGKPEQPRAGVTHA